MSNKAVYRKNTLWPGYVAEPFHRGTTVVVSTHDGVWKVYGPAGEPGHYWLEPVEKIAEAIALTLPYYMLESDDSVMERWTQRQKE